MADVFRVRGVLQPLPQDGVDIGEDQPAVALSAQMVGEATKRPCLLPTGQFCCSR